MMHSDFRQWSHCSWMYAMQLNTSQTRPAWWAILLWRRSLLNLNFKFCQHFITVGDLMINSHSKKFYTISCESGSSFHTVHVATFEKLLKFRLRNEGPRIRDTGSGTICDWWFNWSFNSTRSVLVLLRNQRRFQMRHLRARILLPFVHNYHRIFDGMDGTSTEWTLKAREFGERLLISEVDELLRAQCSRAQKTRRIPSQNVVTSI